MVSADYNGRGEYAAGHHVVEGQTQAMAITQADPTNPGRQPLELDALTGHIQPVVQMRIGRDQLLYLGIRAIDVLRIARKGDPTKWANAPAEQGADIGRHETREIKGVFHADILGHLADIVAII